MTVKEAATALCSVEVPSAAVDLEIINSGLDGASQYSKSMEKQVARISYQVLAGLLPLSSFKEGDLTIQLDRDGIRARLRFLSGTYGFDDVLQAAKPVVRDRSNLW